MRFQIVVMAGKDEVHRSVASERDVHDAVASATRGAYNLFRGNDGLLAKPPAITVTSTPIAE